VVTGHHIPGISAMDDAAAGLWEGRLLELANDKASSADEICAAPAYEARVVPRDELLRDYRLPPTALAPLAGIESPQVLRVTCNGAPWTQMGGVLISIDAGRALAPWDGVFFELARR
jgi:hypothetical protein